MARFKFGIGEFFETLTKGEMKDVLRETSAEQQAIADTREAARGRKYMRLVIRGTAAGGILAMGGDFPNAGAGGVLVPAPQPLAGYAWAMRRMSVAGLTTGTTPDVVNLHRRTPGGQYTGGTLSNGIWQFNGNNFAYTFSHEQIVFLEGETPVLTSFGTFASAGQVVLTADYVEVPQLELVKAR